MEAQSYNCPRSHWWSKHNWKSRLSKARSTLFSKLYFLLSRNATSFIPYLVVTAGGGLVPFLLWHGSQSHLPNLTWTGALVTLYLVSRVCCCPSSPRLPLYSPLLTILQPQRPHAGLVPKLVHTHLGTSRVSRKLFSQPCNGWLFLISQVSDQMSPP